MPWNPAAKHMAKLDELGEKAQNRLRASQNAEGSMGERLKVARSGQGQTAIGARWNKEQNARRVAAGRAEGEEGEEDGAAPPPPARRQAPAAAPFPARPPPPPQRAGAATGPPPPPPQRNGSSSRPPLPARGNSATSSSSASALAPPPRLPPRMNNDAGTPNPPPPYAEPEASSRPAPPPPARRGPPPVPSAGRKPAPAIPTNKPKPPAVPQRTSNNTQPPTAALASVSISTSTPPPPPIASSEPLGPLTASRRPSTSPCSALESATFFCYPTHYAEWSSHPANSNQPWYFRPTQSSPVNMPPTMMGKNDRVWSASVMRRSAGRVEEEEQVGAVLFGDLSSLWYKISYSPSNPAGSMQCKVAYAEPPRPWLDSSLLQSSAASYGELVARACEAWEGQVVGDGECWTLANEAIKQCNESQGWGEDSKMLQTVERTHGHLMYYAQAGKGGLWRGGDVGCVRRGDVLEWDEYAQCKQLSPVKGATVNYGNQAKACPEHTAVVISAPAPSSQRQPDPSGETALRPEEVGWVEVLDQSAGVVVTRSTLDLSQLMRGKLYIYRPVGGEAYLEGKVEAKWEGEGRRRGWEALN